MTHPDLPTEQAYVDQAYDCLDRMREALLRAAEGGATEVAQQAIENWATGRLRTYEDAERGLCLMMHATEPRACLGASPAKSSLPVEELRVRTWPSSGWLACNGLKDVIL